MRKLFAVLMCLCLVTAFTVCAFATEGDNVQSPTDKPVFSVEFISYESGTAHSTEKVVEAGETIELAAPESENGVFTGFTIEGEYELVSGALNKSPIVIRPLSDLIVVANYKDATVDPKPDNPDDNSPQTGDTLMIVCITVAALVAICGAAYATKKLLAKKN